MLLLNSCRFCICIYFVFIHRFLLNSGFVNAFIFNVVIGSMCAMVAEEPEKCSGWLLFFTCFDFFFFFLLPTFYIYNFVCFDLQLDVRQPLHCLWLLIWRKF